MAEEDYFESAKDDAKEAVANFQNEIVEQLIDKGEASDDLVNGYSGGDRYHHETHVDRSYSLLEAAHLLDQLSEWEEGDTGLWEGQLPREAISTQAAYTYGNAVYGMFKDLIETVNDNAREALDSFENAKTDLSTKISHLKGDLQVEQAREGAEGAQERAEDLEKEIGRLERKLDMWEEEPGKVLKRDLENAVLAAIGKKKKPRWTGPKEWSP